MNMTSRPLDLDKVKTVVYHLPDGKALIIPAEIVEHSLDLEIGSVCDISEINGVLHFYPKGHA
jgi:hypothetical protein